MVCLGLLTRITVDHIVIGGIFTAQIAQPDQSLWAHATVNFSRPYFILLLSFNVTASTLLIARLLYMRKQVISAIGPEHARVYTNAATIIVESALPFALYSFVLVVLYGLQNYGEDLLIPLQVQVQVSLVYGTTVSIMMCTNPWALLKAIASEIIILRVVRGRAWTRSTATDIVSSVAFCHNLDTMERKTGEDSGSVIASTFMRKPSSAALHDDASSEGKILFAAPIMAGASDRNTLWAREPGRLVTVSLISLRRGTIVLLPVMLRTVLTVPTRRTRRRP